MSCSVIVTRTSTVPFHRDQPLPVNIKAEYQKHRIGKITKARTNIQIPAAVRVMVLCYLFRPTLGVRDFLGVPID